MCGAGQSSQQSNENPRFHARSCAASRLFIHGASARWRVAGGNDNEVSARDRQKEEIRAMYSRARLDLNRAMLVLVSMLIGALCDTAQAE